MYATWLDSNSWLWEVAGQRILVDPWLVGPLVFGNAPWLFRGERPTPCSLPENIDAILLSQGLEDHAHPQTLEALDKTIPVIGSPNAAKVARQFGFTEVTALDHGEDLARDGWAIKAVPGSPIGPTLLENGYVLTENASGLRLFYEPHGFHKTELRAEAPVDVVITPMLDLALPLVGPIIRGRKSIQELADWLQPQVMLPTANAGEAEYHGLLASLLRVSGSVEAVRRQFAEAGKSIQVIEPKVGDRVELPLTPRSIAA
ncbi:MAG: MBL fold metallo-hydrolase [Leptolyngbya sp. SIO1E4]|nr:MBL fold metallo-hydrolase [Leptolyngbya sp. SIO1E4]